MVLKTTRCGQRDDVRQLSGFFDNISTVISIATIRCANQVLAALACQMNLQSGMTWALCTCTIQLYAVTSGVEIPSRRSVKSNPGQQPRRQLSIYNCCTASALQRKREATTDPFLESFNNATHTAEIQKANTEGAEAGIEPRHDISFCSFQMANTDDEDDEKR